MDREQGLSGVQIWNPGYISFKNRWTVFAFGAGARIRCSPSVESALLGNVENRWTVSEFTGKVLHFLGFRGVGSRIHRPAGWIMFLALGLLFSPAGSPALARTSVCVSG